MVKKTRSTRSRAYKKHTKHLVVKPHHAKPFRKRHIGLLLISLTVVIALVIVLLQYRDQVISGVGSSRNFISDMFREKRLAETTIESTNGFSVSIDQSKLYVMAVDGYSGALYDGKSLSQKRAYSKVQIASSTVASLKESQSVLTITYHTDVKRPLTGNELSSLALSGAGIDRNNIEFLKTEQATIDGKVFEHSVWITKQAAGPVKNLKASFSTYTAEVNGYPLSIVISEGMTGEPGSHKQFDDVLKTLRFGALTASVEHQNAIALEQPKAKSSIIDVIMMANVASAASQSTVIGSEKIAALYSPAVAKIYNVYCMDIYVGGRNFIGQELCGGGTGSGFFVSQDGYFVTNGHVASVNQRDLAIYYAFMAFALGDIEPVSYLLKVAGARESDFMSFTNADELLDKLVDTMYGIDIAKFEKRNDVENLFVVLGDKQPDNAVLLKDTQNRQKASLDSTWKSAKIVASDYRLLDGLKSFHASDVAILKVDGSNFPIAHIGSYNDVSQGSGLSILGFPGTASQNGLVESETTTATLTTGKVSSKKNASGSDKRLIETDTTIGKGNSGGPAFSDDGKVVGIATYTSDGSGSGGGVFNYIRDIKDAQDLAAKNKITFDTASKTQEEWEAGIGFFYESRYSKALKNFSKVKELYPNHNKVAEFIAKAEKGIANGEDVVDFPLIPVIIGASIGGIGLGTGAFLVIRHRKRHVVYKAGVVQGTVVPGETQTVAVTNVPTVQPVQFAQPSEATAPNQLEQPVPNSDPSSQVDSSRHASEEVSEVSKEPGQSQVEVGATEVKTEVNQMQDVSDAQTIQESKSTPLPSTDVKKQDTQSVPSLAKQAIQDEPVQIEPVVPDLVDLPAPRTPVSFSVPPRMDTVQLPGRPPIVNSSVASRR